MKKTFRPSGGHIIDIDPLEIADQYLTRVHNMNTRKGFPSRIRGRRIAYPVSGGGLPNDPLHLLNLQLNSFNWWMSFGASNIYAIEGPNSYNISYASQIAVTDSAEWSSTLLNGIPVFTNGKNPLLYWDGNGANDALEVDDWPAGTVCKFVVAFRYHLFALNIDGPSGEFENMLLHSDAAEPGTLPTSWTPAASNEAGSIVLADTPGKLVTGVGLGQQLMIYKNAAIYAVEYNGIQPDQIFVQRPVTDSVGALGPHCVRSVSTRHLVVGNDDIVLTDGVNIQSIAENRIKNFLANSVDEIYGANSFVIRDLNNKECWICVPESGSQFPTIAHIWDERRDTWTTRDLTAVRYGTTGYVTDETIDNSWDSDSDTWDSDASAWNAGSTGSKTRVALGQASAMYVEDTSDEVELTSYIQKLDMILDDDTQNKLTQRVWISGSGDGFTDLEFRLGTRQATDQPITWGSYATIGEDGTPYEISGRFVSIEMRAITGQLFTIDRFAIEARFNGPY